MKVPHPDYQLGGQAEVRAELAAQLALLEVMFDDPGLSRLRKRFPGHPAVVRHDALRTLQDQATHPELENELIQQIALALMDRSTWAPDPTLRPFWELSVPDIDRRAQVLARIGNPEQFDDVMLELYLWGRLRAAGFLASLVEREGRPDITINWEGKDVQAEVKRIHVGTSRKRVRSVIAKANKQIKAASPGAAGIAFIYVESRPCLSGLGETRVVARHPIGARRTQPDHHDPDHAHHGARA